MNTEVMGTKQSLFATIRDHVRRGELSIFAAVFLQEEVARVIDRQGFVYRLRFGYHRENDRLRFEVRLDPVEERLLTEKPNEVLP